MAVNTDGHLNTALLQKEFSNALHADDKRKKADDMKKRAIHTAGSYDEFRHMVSCAELKTVSRKEMESLGHQQKGWRKTASKPPPKHKAGAAADKTASSKLVRKGPLQAPTTQSEFERDWRRRCKTHADMVALLGLVGASGMPKLFKVELDPQLLGQILGVLSRCAAADSALPPCQPRNSSSDDGDAANGHQAGGGESVARCIAWLRGIQGTGRFALNVHFLSDRETAALGEMVDALMPLAEAQQAEELRELRKVYGVDK